MSRLVQELIDRNKCQSSIITHGLIESSSSDIAERIATDLAKLKSVHLSCASSLSGNIKLYRVGRRIIDKSRPLKVIMSCRDEAFAVISQFNNFKKSGANFSGKILSIVHDKT